jgi:hypothetical protein
MTKSLLTGIVVCGALAVFAANTDVYAAKSSVQTTKPAQQEQTAPLPVQDCIHVAFPQCSGGADGG